MKKTISRLKDILKPHIKTVILVSIFAILIDIIEIVKPYITKIVIDDFLANKLFNNGMLSIDILGMIYLGLVILGATLDYTTRMKTNIMGEKILFEMRNKIFRYSQFAEVKFHDKTPAGKLYARIINDIDDVSNLFKDVISTLFKDIISIVSVIGIMIYFSYKLSILALSVLPFVIIISIVLTKVLNHIYDVSKAVRTNLNTFFAESIYGAKIIKIFSIQKEKIEECEGYTKEFMVKRMPSAVLEGIFPGIMIFFENLATTFIIVGTVYHVFGIVANVGEVFIFTTYIKSLFRPINRIIDAVETIQEAIVSIDKIYDILENEDVLEDFDEGIVLPKKIPGKIEFKNVWFAYKDDNWILKNVSFTIEPGETIALVGRTGSGKTTITNLVNRFYEIQKGEILIDGINIKDINKSSLREHVGIVLQDPFIFSRTIKENIRLNQDISDDNIKKAITDASAKEFIDTLPEGINEVSKERGESFSAGQKQLIAFARIFAHDPDIFILDEATANIDTYTEGLIQKSIDRLSKEKTAIFIAHRLSTIVNVDKILVLQNGEIIEEGSHKDLLEQNGAYAKLYNQYYESLG